MPGSMKSQVERKNNISVKTKVQMSNVMSLFKLLQSRIFSSRNTAHKCIPNVLEQIFKVCKSQLIFVWIVLFSRTIIQLLYPHLIIVFKVKFKFLDANFTRSGNKVLVKCKVSACLVLMKVTHLTNNNLKILIISMCVPDSNILRRQIGVGYESIHAFNVHKFVCIKVYFQTPKTMLFNYLSEALQTTLVT